MSKPEKTKFLGTCVLVALYDLRFHYHQFYSIPEGEFLYVSDLQLTRHLKEWWWILKEDFCLSAPHLQTVQKILNGLKMKRRVHPERKRNWTRVQNTPDSRPPPAWLFS